MKFSVEDKVKIINLDGMFPPGKPIYDKTYGLIGKECEIESCIPLYRAYKLKESELIFLEKNLQKI